MVDPTFDCNINRTKGDTASQMYLINHFLDKIISNVAAPDVDRANVTNGVSGPGSLGLQREQCAAIYGKNPTFMLVDVSLPFCYPSLHPIISLQFYEYGGGSVFQVAAAANGVTYSPSKPIATPLPQTPTSSSSPGSNSALELGMIGKESLVLLAGILFGAWSVA